MTTTDDTTDELRTLSEQSRRRLAAIEELREQNRLIAVHSARRLEASRQLLQRSARTDLV